MMNVKCTLSIAVLAALLASPPASFGQATQQDDSRRIPAAKGTSEGTASGGAQYGQGGSAHCDSLSGDARAQCLRDEGAKTDSKAEPESASGATSSSEHRLPAERPERPAAK